MNRREHIDAMLDEFPVLETKRLLLKRIEPADVESVFAMRALSATEEFIGRTSLAAGPEQAEYLKQKTKSEYLSGDAIAWLASLKGVEAETVIGTCCFMNIDYETGHAELSGEMSVANWGKYYAVEGTLALVSFGLNKLRLSAIDAIVSSENTSAIYLLEKLGFIETGHVKSNGTAIENVPGMLVFSRTNSI
jgi:ribosomal-protein-alanine N-acetyltransferase